MAGFGRRLRAQALVDTRILKAQIDFVVEAFRATIYTSPAWALALAVLCGDILGVLGNVPLWRCLVFVGSVLGSSIAIHALVKSYEASRDGPTAPEDVRRWFARFINLQLTTSFIWGLAAWWLWDPGNSSNHIFLALVEVCVIAGFLVSRSSHIEVFMASIGPLGVLTFARFAFGDGPIDLTIAALLPFFLLQIGHDGNGMSRRVDRDTRLRFENETLARELEEARDEALRKRFEAETANASKTAFLANMSHELRTPLNAILGFSEIIAKECLGPVGSRRYKEYAGDIHTSGSHLLSLINDLLDVAKIEAGRMELEPQMLETERTLQVALKLVSVRAKERHQHLSVLVEPTAPPLYADERAIKQIVINLVSNSVKFTPEGGRIAVTARRAPEGAFELIVEDNGPGIAKDKIDHIFKPFSQIDNRYDRQAGGTGLGLALVRGLADLHGGRAWIESEEGKGTKAFVVLPVGKRPTVEEVPAA